MKTQGGRGSNNDEKLQQPKKKEHKGWYKNNTNLQFPR